jgi:hypothetical protein
MRERAAKHLDVVHPLESRQITCIFQSAGYFFVSVDQGQTFADY